MMTGIEHITQTFERTKARGRAALMPYYTLGFPDRATSMRVVEAIANARADLIELGVPFSDPLADGPTIQASTQKALENGMNLGGCLALTRQLRERGVRQPLMLMGYYNPILAYGVEAFVTEAAEAGADGFIVPDLPPEEAEQMEASCQVHGRALIYLLAPTSSPERCAMVAQRSTGFIYLVSVTGVTGARAALPSDLEKFVGRVRSTSDKPLAVGFGISTPEQAAAVGNLADGVIVGSALIKTVSEADDPVASAAAFVSSLAGALAPTPAIR
jgi:tryptophan synthase alpha chain